MIGIVNYGSGNIQAIANIYNRSNIPFQIIEDPNLLKKADKLILPGVGSFDATMQQLNDSGLKSALDEEVLVNNKPVLGVCVGMQILSEGSEEGVLPGLGWIKGKVKKFDISKIKEKPYLPHMGWNTVIPKISHDLFNGIDQELGFYFVHSFYFETLRQEDILGTTFYGGTFSSAVLHNQIFGMQFHPEKSHFNGIQLLSNFAKL
ncbi:imidazole glycerol phosphate synthase subunit HisH [Algoriphagus sp.]|uniref:imidazole glycerol phosphate synthase subunit HisH n=1 Tax=Algoriphagus sp. TaxID=1872435 RepID=UPI00271EBB30|nr:imidazole glycerol phosphate synthase subunit HisH [Algoriphagus sp.]MDO8965696.1 imidazole glycerol phosphate synthase subunit HisH [Algoriphagus sp.]MDP3202389.1 imidazole glycerol phosphate synthase subunit HisH [Algoriphagus sp.]